MESLNFPHRALTKFIFISLGFPALFLSAVSSNAGVMTSASEEPIGVVEKSSGDAHYLSPKGKNIQVQPDLPVFQGDRFETGKDSDVQIKFTDRSLLTMGSNSSIVMETAADNSEMQIRILSGAFRLVTSKSETSDSSRFNFDFPSAMIRVHGRATVLGQVSKKRTIIILWKTLGPAEAVVYRKSKGKFVFETKLTEESSGCIIEEDSAAKEEKISASEIKLIESDLGPSSAPSSFEIRDQGTGLSIQEIIRNPEDPNRRLAVIDGKFYPEGTVIKNLALVSIGNLSVKTKNQETGEEKVVFVENEPRDQEEKKKSAPAASAGGNFAVEGIFITKDAKSVVTKAGEVYHAGQSMNGVQILKVTPEGILVLRPTADDPEWILVPKEDSSKHTEILPFLQSLAYDQKNPSGSLVTINRRIYRQGSVISGFTITQIEPDGILLKNNSTGKTQKLFLEKNSQASNTGT